ncbi:hypothetical protein MHI49_28450 [Bacillus sp. FSL M7-0884]|uniref:hypothetical protein n=1 Tax=Bacillus sp. FSL M7-0884 TaxID=2921537 RepID=UPI0030F76781
MAVYFPVPTYEDYEIAEKNGISKETVYQRIHYRGKTVKQAITEPLWNGSFREKYQNYIEIAEQNGISYPTFHARLTKKTVRKWTPEEAATVPPKITGRIRKSRANGPTEEDYKEAERNGISRKNVNQRLDLYDWSIEKSITDPVNKRGRKDDNTRMLMIAKQNGISTSTFYRRIREGMLPRDAAMKPKGHSAYIELARENGINDICFYKRVERGMHPYLAATKPKDKRGSAKKKQIS